MSEVSRELQQMFLLLVLVDLDFPLKVLLLILEIAEWAERLPQSGVVVVVVNITGLFCSKWVRVKELV